MTTSVIELGLFSLGGRWKRHTSKGNGEIYNLDLVCFGAKPETAGAGHAANPTARCMLTFAEPCRLTFAASCNLTFAATILVHFCRTIQLDASSFLAKGIQLESFQGLSPESQGQIPAWTVLYVPYWLAIGSQDDAGARAASFFLYFIHRRSLQSDQLVTTHRSPSRVNQDHLHSCIDRPRAAHLATVSMRQAL